MRLEDIGQTLAHAYDDVLSEGIPEQFVRLLDGPVTARSTCDLNRKQLAVVIDRDRDARALAETILEESSLAVIGCETGECALAALHCSERPAALVFVDANLSGLITGLQLAGTVAARWPETRLIITSRTGVDELEDVPDDATLLTKPWSPLDIFLEAERAHARAVSPAS